MNKLHNPSASRASRAVNQTAIHAFLARAMGGKQGTIAAVAFFTAGGI